MVRKKTASTTSAKDDDATRNGADSFTHQIKQALEHCMQPSWLGENSPLAAPYFLGERLAGQQGTDTSAGRGKLLQQLLIETVLMFADGDKDFDGDAINFREVRNRLEKGNFDQRLLYWYFLYHPRPSREMIISKLGVQLSSASYHRRIKDVTELFARALIGRVNLALRLEMPTAPQALIGRDALVTPYLEALRAGRTMALSGPGGVGKTALSAHLLAALVPQPVFWYPVRLGLNDNLGSLLFALSYFLSLQGANTAWLQLIADRGAVQFTIVQSLIQRDLEHLSASRPVLCFDEIDLLRPSEVAAHAQLLAFVDSLRHETSLLLVGQQVPLEADLRHTLGGLDCEATKQLLMQASIELSANEIVRLHTYTDGNPRLLELFIGLSRSGEPLLDALASIATTPSIDALLRRILQRLADDESMVLMALAVFRRPAPGDAWEEQILERLIDRHLVQRDERGGVMIIPAFRMALYGMLSLEAREALHLEAAHIRAARGEHTAAAYHYLQANQPGMAVWAWYPYRAQEINQGQASAALELLKQVSANLLDEEERRFLALARGELELMVGSYDQTLAALGIASWPPDDVLTVLAKRMEGSVAALKSEFDHAATAFREGLETVERLTGEVAQLRKNLGWIAMRQKKLGQAWHEACLARYEAENVQGFVQETMGNYIPAHAHYLAALDQAKTANYTPGEAKTHNNLARLLAILGAFDDARFHGQQAVQLYNRIGDRAMVSSVKLNQAMGWNLAERPDRAIPLAQEALEWFERIDEPWGKAVAAQNLAEAYLALGDLASAERFVTAVLDEEEVGVMPDGLRVLGEVKLAQGDGVSSERLITQSIEIAEQNQDRYLAAYGWRALGKLYLVQHKLKEAEDRLHKAIELFAELALPGEVERTEALRREDINEYSER